MPYKFQAGKLYRMPTHFGPSLGPRQGDRGKFDNTDNPKTTSISVSFLTNRRQLEALLPEGFEVGAEPVVTVRASYTKEIPWLAGRGYNRLGVSFPAVFRGLEDQATGDFLAVLWENLADPIITGREELGFSKVYCELPEPSVYQGEIHCTAGWLGFKFMDLRIRNMGKLPPEAVSTLASSPTGDGMLHFKYIPRTGDWGQADAAYATLTPAADADRRLVGVWQGEGTVEFHRATWEDLPTLYHIVNTLHALEVEEPRGARMMMAVGGKDLSDQRILR